MAGQHQENGCPAVLLAVSCRRDQRNSCSTLACAWLASASAETAIDWRVASAWLLAASSLVSASVRLAEPVCSTLIRFFEKSWRICTIERFEPRVEASVRSAFDALLILAIVALAEALSRKSVPGTSEARPRPAASKVTPWMVRVDLPVSLKVSLRSSPFSRLMPLNEASCDVVVICWMTLLYWLTRLARMVCEAASATGAAAAATAVKAAAVPPTAPSVDEAASFVVVNTSLPALFKLADTLFAANAAFNWSRDSLAPKIMLVAVPPPVAAIVSVSPDAMFVPSTKLAAVPTVVADVVDDLVE